MGLDQPGSSLEQAAKGNDADLHVEGLKKQQGLLTIPQISPGETG
jgi:hypothetical protein